MTTNKKFKCLSIISVFLFFTGIIFFFIKTPVGIIVFFICFGINFYIQKKFPDDFKRIVEENGRKPKTLNVKYIEGLKNFNNNTNIKISMPDKIFILSDGSQTREIKLNDIEHAAILEEITNDIKDKSVIARALVGGILLGGVGAVVGGLSGVMPTYKKNKNYYLQIKVKSGEDFILTGKINVLKQIKERIIKNV